MNIVKLAAVAALVLPVAAQAEPRVYPYDGIANYCPAGQQPVTMNGVICCGVPNQSVSYQSVMRHGATSKRRAPVATGKSSNVICPEGQKGCYTN